MQQIFRANLKKKSCGRNQASCVRLKQCCGCASFLCGSGDTLTKIDESPSVLDPALRISPVQNMKKFQHLKQKVHVLNLGIILC
jgi:hypothetical protein